MTTFCLVLGAAILAAILLPDIYRSSTEMRIDLEGPNVDLLEPLALTNYADQYIDSLQRRVITDDQIVTWIEETNAYPGHRDDHSMSDLVKLVRDNIRIQMVTTTAMQPSSGKPIDLITGFLAAFDAQDANDTLLIAKRLAAAFLEEDKKIRTERAAVASSFLIEEIDVKRQEITRLEAEIAEFKEENAGSLPELMSLNMSVLNRTERDMEAVGAEMRVLQQDKIFRDSQLEEIRLASESADRLKQLEDEYLSAISIYGPDHPDVVRIKRQVAALTGGAVDSGKSNEIIQLEIQLTEARQRYSDLHPDVLSLRKRLERLRSQDSASSSEEDINPKYLQLHAQKNALDTQLAGLRDRDRVLRFKYDEIQDRIARMPQVERQYLALARDLQTEQLAFNDLRKRLAQAQQTESFESGERGARLVKIRNASLPKAPVAPPRLAIAIFGGILAVSLAIGATVLTEALDGSIRGRRDILTLVNTMPIAEIPVIRGSGSVFRLRRQAGLIRTTVLFILVGGVILMIWSGA